MFKFTFSISKHSTMVYYPLKNMTVHVNHLNPEDPTFTIFGLSDENPESECDGLCLQNLEEG